MEARTEWPLETFQEFTRAVTVNGGTAPTLAGKTVAQFRADAFRCFSEVGFPTTRNEDWRYTNLAPLARGSFKRAAEGGAHAGKVAGHSAWRVVVVNGVFRPEHSEIPERSDLHIGSIREALTSDGREGGILREHLGAISDLKERPLLALNSAFLDDGVFIWVKKHALVDQPVDVVFLTEGESVAVYPRALIVAEEGSKAHFVEYHSGSGHYFSCPVTEVFVGPNATLEHVKIQQESRQALHVGSLEVRVGRSGNFTSQLFHLGGGTVRNEIYPVLAGEGCECYLNGLTVLNGEQHVDNFTVIDHAMPHCFSREIYKGIYDDRTSGVFSGTIIVRPGAQKTNAIQSNNSILLSDDASIETKPQLKIWADDVKCTHGATVGQLDDKALFYLQARGIPVGEARKILIHAFASDVINHLSDEPLKAFLEAELYQALKF